MDRTQYLTADSLSTRCDRFARRRTALVVAAALAVVALVSAGCAGDDGDTATTVLEAPDTPPGVTSYRIDVLEERPHDPDAYTQGLEFDDRGRLFESTGEYGSSDLREVDPETGEVLRSEPLDDSLFGEGVTVVDDTLIQLTWREGRALVWQIDPFVLIDELAYDGEGWGLCLEGEQLVMSNGSSSLAFRDPASMALLDTVVVTYGGLPLNQLNELECLGDGRAWANVYQTDRLVLIDLASGEVVGEADGSALGPQPRRSGEVLNGIAREGSGDTFLITGKRWPKIYRVRFVAVD